MTDHKLKGNAMSNPEMRTALAQSKSYVSAAIVTFVAYIFFWLPGLIFNVMYLQDARKNAKIAGESLPGTGCLWILLIVNVVPLLLLCSAVTGASIFGGG